MPKKILIGTFSGKPTIIIKNLLFLDKPEALKNKEAWRTTKKFSNSFRYKSL